MTTINIRSILLGIYIAASIATMVLANDETKPKKTRTRRLRRASNVVKVDGIEEGDRSREEQIAATENINRILARSDDDEARSTNKKKNRQLIQAGIVENMNRKPVLSEVDVMKIMAKEIQWAQGTFQMSMPTRRPGPSPTRNPTRRPTNAPEPTRNPTSAPGPDPSPDPAPVVEPTRNPTRRPTRTPTRRPTDRPIRDPTYSPTLRPTPRPTQRNPTDAPETPSPTDPAPVDSPTNAPVIVPTPDTVCGGLTPEERETLIEGQLATYSSTQVTTTGTPQNQAFQWLINDDPMQVCPEDFLDVQQRYILAVLYYSTEGDGWSNCNAPSAPNLSPCREGEEQRFLSSSDVCFWFGITCNRLRVSGISIDENNLRGPLPDELGFMEQIEDIDFDGELEEGLNFITGTIPSTLGLLEKLVTLDLDSNELTGSIPEEIFDASRLTIMDLDSNELTGTLSSGFANLAELQILFLDNNGFYGSLPSEMGEMERLRFLRLDRNELSGTIPQEWEAMANLRVLFVNNNAQVTGTIPEYLGDFVDMQQLSLFDTGISGTVPSSLGQLTSLVNLFLHFTDLTGTMPQEICDLRTSGALNFLTADCAGDNPKLACSQPDCCTVCF